MRSGAAAAASHPSSQMSSSELVLCLLTLSVILRVINFHRFKLPNAIFIAVSSIFLTAFLVVLSSIPNLGIHTMVGVFRSFLETFPELVLHYMLGFLLFAAALEVKKQMLERIWTTVIALSVFSTAISTIIVSILTYLLMQSISEMEFAHCLLFGAIVSPTDPVTVMSIAEKADLLYLVFKEIVQKPDIRTTQVIQLLLNKVVRECVVGALIGVSLAWVAYSAIKSVKDPLLEVMITFVLVGNINMICTRFHASIPLASVFAGLFVGNYGVEFAMDANHRDMFKEIWKLTDDTLNSVLFLMIGAAELFWNPQALGIRRVVIIVVSIICISIFARAVSVALPLITIIFLEWATGRRLRHPAVKYRGGTIAVLTWAGMRGGISIALALGIPDAFVVHSVPGHMTNGQLIFFMTFTLVVFPIIVQGLYFEPVVRAITRVSFRIMPTIGTSGGLSTFVSTMDLTAPGNPIEIDGLENESPDPAFEEEFAPWVTAGGNHDDDNTRLPVHTGNVITHSENHRSISFLSTSNGPPLINGGNVNLNTALNSRFRDSPDTSDNRYGTPSNLDRTRSLHRFSSIHTRFRSREERSQGSATFANLRGLQEPITVNEVFAKGSEKIRRFFDSGMVTTTTQENYALRRSRTAPNNAQYVVRFEDTARSSQDDLSATLSSAIRNNTERP